MAIPYIHLSALKNKKEIKAWEGKLKNNFWGCRR